MTGGTSVRAFPVPPLPSLAEMAEGSLVKMNESGAPVEFYVAKHDYESELNGAGRTLVVRKDVWIQRNWNSGNLNAWATCVMLSQLNSTYKALLDSGIQEAMGTTTYRYTPGDGDNTVTTRADAVILLSMTELGQSHIYARVEGSALPIASMLQVAYQNGSATTQWTRSPYTYDRNSAWYLDSDGRDNSRLCTGTYGTRPCFTLPSTVLVDEAMNIVA